MNRAIKLIVLLVLLMHGIVYGQQCTALGLIFPQNLEEGQQNIEIKKYNNTNTQEIINITILSPTSFTATQITKNNLTINNLTYNVSLNNINSTLINSANIKLFNVTYNITENRIDANFSNFTISYNITFDYRTNYSLESRKPYNYVDLPFTDYPNTILISNFLIKNKTNYSTNNIPTTFQNGTNSYYGPAALRINSTLIRFGKTNNDTISVNVNSTWYEVIGDLGSGDVSVFRLVDFNSTHLCYKLILARPSSTNHERCFPKSNTKIYDYYLYNISYYYTSHIQGFDGFLFVPSSQDDSFPYSWVYNYGDNDFRFFHLNVSDTYYLTFITNQTSIIYFRTESQGSYVVHQNTDGNYRMTVYKVKIEGDVINFSTIFTNASNAVNFSINYNTYLNEKNAFQSGTSYRHIFIVTLFNPLKPARFSSHGEIQHSSLMSTNKSAINAQYNITFNLLRILNLSINEQTSMLSNLTYVDGSNNTVELKYKFSVKIINTTITEELDEDELFVNGTRVVSVVYPINITNTTKNTSHNLSAIVYKANDSYNTFRNEINMTYVSNQLNIPFNALFNYSTYINQSRSYFENNRLYEHINSTHLRIYDISSTNRIDKSLLSSTCQNKNINNDITDINQLNQFHECYSRTIVLDQSNSSLLNNTYSKISDFVPNKNTITFYKASKQPETNTNLTQFCKANILYSNSLILPEIIYYPNIRQSDAIYFYPYNENYEIIIGNNTAVFLYDKDTNQWYYIPPITCTSQTVIPVSAYVLSVQQSCGVIDEQTSNLFNVLGFIMNNILTNCNIDVDNVQCTFTDNSGMVENFRIRVYDVAFNQNKLLCTAYGTTSATCSSADSSILVDVAFLYQGQYYHLKQFTQYKQPTSFLEPQLLFITIIGLIFLIFGAFAYSSQALIAVIFLLGLVSVFSIFTLDFVFIVVISIVAIIFFILMNRKTI